MCLNFIIAFVFFIAFSVASIASSKNPSEQGNIFVTNCILFPVILSLGVAWGADINDLLLLKTIGKSGVAVGIMYGCVFGSGIGFIWSLVRNNKGDKTTSDE